MTLFELNAEYERLANQAIDLDTGEINEEALAQLDAVEMDRDEKRDNWCFFIKQKRAEVEAAKELVNRMRDRYLRAENALISLEKHFAVLMNGEKYKSPYNTVYYTHSEAVELDEGKSVLDIDDDYLNFILPTLNKQKIKAAIKLGESVPGVHLAEKQSMVIR